MNIVQFLLAAPAGRITQKLSSKGKNCWLDPQPGRNHTKALYHNLIFYSVGILITERERNTAFSSFPLMYSDLISG